MKTLINVFTSLAFMADPILSEIHDDNRRVIELIRISDEDVHYRQTIHATFEFIVMDEASVSSSY